MEIIILLYAGGVFRSLREFVVWVKAEAVRSQKDLRGCDIWPSL